jgi:hypothetical protein
MIRHKVRNAYDLPRLCRKKVSSSEIICLPCSDLTQLGRAQNFIRINRFVAKASIGPYT